MFPTWFIVTFYALSAAAIGWLIVRMVWKNRTAPQPRRIDPPPVASPVAPAPTAWEPRLAPALAAIPVHSGDLPQIRPDQTPIANDRDYYFGAWTPGMSELLPDTDARREELRQELQTAGYYSPHALTNFSAIRYVLMMTLLILAGTVLILVPRQFEPFAIGAIIAGPILGWS